MTQSFEVNTTIPLDKPTDWSQHWGNYITGYKHEVRGMFARYRKDGFAYVFGVFVLVALGLASLFGQGTARGTLVGTVTDSSGAVVPAARVKITNVATGIEESVLT